MLWPASCCEKPTQNTPGAGVISIRCTQGTPLAAISWRAASSAARSSGSSSRARPAGGHVRDPRGRHVRAGLPRVRDGADPRPGAYYDWRAATDVEINTAIEFRDTFAQHDIPLQAAAVQFPLRHPAISSVGIGARNATQSKGNVDFLTWSIPDLLWRELKV